LKQNVKILGKNYQTETLSI